LHDAKAGILIQADSFADAEVEARTALSIAKKEVRIPLIDGLDIIYLTLADALANQGKMEEAQMALAETCSNKERFARVCWKTDPRLSTNLRCGVLACSVGRPAETGYRSIEGGERRTRSIQGAGFRVSSLVRDLIIGARRS
jgi:hypothetical protein